MVKQSCTSANDKSQVLQPAAANALLHARRGPSNSTASRREMGRKSLTCSRERKRTARRKELARSSETRTSAAAPSETSEQSVLRNGAAMSGFFSDTVLQNSKPRS